jgi:hypothetical protein
MPAFGFDLEYAQSYISNRDFTRAYITTELTSRPGWQIHRNVSLEWLLGTAPALAFSAAGASTKVSPNIGFVTFRGKLVAILDDFYQASHNNAVERMYRWIAMALMPQVAVPLDQLLFVVWGAGFRKKEGVISGQTGAFVEVFSHLPTPLLVNPNPDTLDAQLQALIQKVEARALPFAA